MIIIKSAREIELMKKAGECLQKLFVVLREATRPGISTLELDQLAEKTMLENDCTPACKGYYGYPGAICISVNDTLIHGIPSAKIVLKEGDIVSYDCVATYHGYNADATRTYPVGIVTERCHRIIDVCKGSFFEGVRHIREGARLGDCQEAIQKYVEGHGYSVCREYTGHGIGAHMHEDPSIPNYGKAGTGPVLAKGMAIAIEPMILEGKPSVRVLGDGWTVKSRDGKLTCHYENTIVLTDDGVEIITMSDEEKKEENV